VLSPVPDELSAVVLVPELFATLVPEVLVIGVPEVTGVLTGGVTVVGASGAGFEVTGVVVGAGFTGEPLLPTTTTGAAGLDTGAGAGGAPPCVAM